MAQVRKTGICSGCNQQKEIYDVKDKLCNSCWRSRDRWVKSGGDPLQRRQKTNHLSAAVRGESGNPLMLYARFVDILEKFGCSDKEVAGVIVIIRHHVKSAEKRLNRPFKLLHERERKAKNDAKYKKKKAREKAQTSQS